jgi:hypothetical protein
MVAAMPDPAAVRKERRLTAVFGSFFDFLRFLLFRDIGSHLFPECSLWRQRRNEHVPLSEPLPPETDGTRRTLVPAVETGETLLLFPLSTQVGITRAVTVRHTEVAVDAGLGIVMDLQPGDLRTVAE